MRNTNEGGTGNTTLFFLAQPPRPDKCGGHTRDTFSHGTISDVNTSSSNARARDVLGQLQASRSASIKAEPLSAPVQAHGQPEHMEDPALHGSDGPRWDHSCDASGSHSHAGAKRARPVVFTAGLTDMDPLLSFKSRRVMSIPSHVGEEPAGDPTMGLPQTTEPTSSARQPAQQGQTLNSLLACATSAIRGDGGAAAVISRPASVPVPGPRTSNSSIRSDWGPTASSSRLSTFLSSTSPAVMEQLLAAAMTGSALPEPGRNVTASVTAVSAETTMCAPPTIRASASQPPCGSLPFPPGDPKSRPAQPDPDGSAWASGSAAAAATTAATATLVTSCAQPFAPGSTGKAPVTREDWKGSSGSPAHYGPAAIPSLPANGKTRGAARQAPVAAAAAAAAAMDGKARSGRPGDGEPAGAAARLAVPGGAAKRAAAGARCLQASADVDAGGGDKQVGGKAAEPAAAAPALEAADQPAQATEPLTAQLGAALPPALAARLKKPIRIIQPISTSWELETLQCGGGSAAPPAAAAAAGTPPLPPPPADVKPATEPGLGSVIKDQQVTDCAVAPAAAIAAGGGAGVNVAGAVGSRAGVGGPRLAGFFPGDRDAGSLPVGNAPVRRGNAAVGAPARGAAPQHPPDGGAKAAALAAAAAAAPPQSAAGFASACGHAPPSPPVPPSAAATSMTMAGSPADAAHLASLAPALAALAALPLAAADSASPFTAGCWFANSACGPTTGSTAAAAAMLPPVYGSSGTIGSGTLPTGVIPAFSSGCLPNGPSGVMSRAAALGDWGHLVAAAAAGGTGEGLAAHFETLSGRQNTNAMSAAAIRAAGLHSNGGVPATGDVLVPPSLGGASGAVAAAAAAAGLPAPLPLHPRPPLQVLQRSTTAAASGSASCLGKVQGELTLLYQWYVANKTVYLDQAQRQLQRIEELTAAREGAGEAAGGADGTAAASAKVESAEAMRAFETALKIMRVCGRVEQQWLALPTGPLPGAHPGTLEAPPSMPPPPPPPLAQAPMQLDLTAPPPCGPPSRVPTGATPLGMPGLGPGTSGLGSGAAAADGVQQLPLNVPAPSSGWSHGAGAALAVAAALVGSVSRAGFPGGPVGPGHEPSLAGGLPAVATRGAAAAAAGGPGARPLNGLPVSWTMPGIKPVAATGPSRLGMAAAVPPPPAPPPLGAAVVAPGKITRLGQPAAA